MTLNDLELYLGKYNIYLIWHWPALLSTCPLSGLILYIYVQSDNFVSFSDTEASRHADTAGRWNDCVPVWAQECCRISPSRFLVECLKRWLNQASFVVLYFALFVLSELYLICAVSVFSICLLSCIFQYVPTWMALYSLIVLMCR